MGYYTSFGGEFAIVPPLTLDHRAYLAQFAETRRMKRNVLKLGMRPDPLRNAVGLPLGVEGEFYVSGEGAGSLGEPDESVTNVNEPPATQPGLWCPWAPSEDGTALCPPEEESKAYDYVHWLKYIVDRFITPWGYSLCGIVHWDGEESDDFGQIKIESPTNEILLAEGQLSYGAWRGV